MANICTLYYTGELQANGQHSGFIPHSEHEEENLDYMARMVSWTILLITNIGLFSHQVIPFLFRIPSLQSNMCVICIQVHPQPCLLWGVTQRGASPRQCPPQLIPPQRRRTAGLCYRDSAAGEDWPEADDRRRHHLSRSGHHVVHTFPAE